MAKVASLEMFSLLVCKVIFGTKSNLSWAERGSLEQELCPSQWTALRLTIFTGGQEQAGLFLHEWSSLTTETKLSHCRFWSILLTVPIPSSGLLVYFVQSVTIPRVSIRKQVLQDRPCGKQEHLRKSPHPDSKEILVWIIWGQIKQARNCTEEQ